MINSKGGVNDVLLLRWWCYDGDGADSTGDTPGDKSETGMGSPDWGRIADD